ncbi:MAG: phosphonate C-P lyase system protein PhnH [Hyphomicrobiaceae bacterium]|nr:phosphonate C-P lyase system protein PhnH [Hyphomicrobiaceae bacterium]
MDATPSLLPGFADSVGDAQRVFKAVMQAMARPARPVALDVALRVPPPLTAVAAGVLLALADYETPLWLDPSLRQPDILQFLSFHTGARLARAADEAQFVLAAGPAAMPRLAALRQGTPEYPDRSATLIVAVEAFSGEGLLLEGPGIKGRAGFSFAGLPAWLADDLRHNRAQFPCGVDLVLAAPGAVAALPRSVRLVTEG